MDIKSITDVITNSSSECFLVRTYGKTPKEILEELEAVGDDGCSGMGGDLGVYNSVSQEGEYGEGYEHLSPEFAVVDMDWSKDDLKRYLFKHFFVIDSDYSIVVDPNTGRGLGMSHWEDMKNYPKEWTNSDSRFLSDLEYEAMYEEEREEQKDPEAYLKKMQKFYKQHEKKAKEDKDYKEQWDWFKADHPTPEAYVAYWTLAVEKWFKKHPVPIREQLKYDYDKDKID